MMVFIAIALAANASLNLLATGVHMKDGDGWATALAGSVAVLNGTALVWMTIR